MLLIALCLLLLVVPASAQEPIQEPIREIHEYGDWDYVTNETGLTVITYRGNEKNIEIPESIFGITVTELGEDLFKNNTNLQSVVVSDGVQVIGSYAFHGCTSLTDVRLPARLSRIESYTFRYCTALEKIQLPSQLRTIAGFAFAGCINLQEIVIPDSVTSIGESAFEDCTSLQRVSVSKNATVISGNCFNNTPWLDSQTDEFVLVGNTILLKWNGTSSIADIPYGVTMITDAFADNNYVESVVIPNSVTRIGMNAFRNAVNLKTITIPDTVSRIDSHAFRDCRSLRTITLPDSVTIIGSHAFRGCEKLTGFEFPPQITSINSYVLADCPSLTDVVLPAKVTSIHALAFSGSSHVRFHVTYDSEGERFAQSNSIAYTYYLQQTKDFIYSRNDDGIQILRYVGNLYDVDVPAEIDGYPVNKINTAAFQNNSVARRITLPDSVTVIGDWAFSYMDSLESIRLSAKLKSLGADAFASSQGLKSITLPNGLEEIGVEPFAGIENLEIIADRGSRAAEILSKMGYVIGPRTAVRVETKEPELIETAADTEVLTYTETAEVITETPEPTMTVISASETPEPTMTVITATETHEATMTAITATVTREPVLPEVSTQSVTLSYENVLASLTSQPSPAVTATPAAPTETAAVPTITSTPTSAFTMTPTATITPAFTATAELRTKVRIPDGTTAVTSSMLSDTAEELTLIIPASVTYIDDSIAEDHELTIVSSTNTEAEKFARKWDVKFLIDLWYEDDVSDSETVSSGTTGK